MTHPLLLCLIPAERAALAATIRAAGGVAVLDLTASPSEARLPEGAWVRARAAQLIELPGSGPIILAGAASSTAMPHPARPTWLELTTPQAVPPGFAGVVLRGAEAGGPCGSRSVQALLAALPPGTPALLAADLEPAAAARLARHPDVQGILLADILLAHPALSLPPRLAARVAQAGPDTTHVVRDFQVTASPLAPGLRRLLEGADPWLLTAGWLQADDPGRLLMPAGPGLALGRQLARTFPALERLLGAYIDALLPAAPAPAPAPAAEAAAVAAPAGGQQAEGVAIIGMGCRLPDADSLAAFWDNLVAGRSSIIDVPPDRWTPELYWSTDRKAPDKTYARIGGFLQGFQFNPRRFRIPPMMAKMVDPVQQLALESVADALEDAGYGDDRAFDRSRVAVILGNSMGGEYTDDYAIRARYPALAEALQRVPALAALPAEARAAVLAGFEDAVKAELPPLTEDSMPGELANVIAGRVANAFDLTGPNFTVDAACASSMAAIQTAVKGLLAGEIDMAVTGGSDRSMGVPTYVKFSKIGALSATHSAPFDASADGFVMGEGCGVLVLKRLSDAQADGDRIYAVIRGVGGSSDGKGKGIMAPNPRGQKLALQRAYAQAGIDPASVDLFECHGTSTFVGDRVELESLAEVIGPGRREAADPVRVGSVKSNIGHLKSAAGAAAMIKAALALHHKVLPPSINFRAPRTDVDTQGVPLQVQDRAEPWQTPRRRRAGVSAFGFGGVNYHAVLEEHLDGDAPVVSAVVAPQPGLPAGVWGASAGSSAELLARLQAAPRTAPPFAFTDAVRVTGGDGEPLAEQVERVTAALEKGRNLAMLRSRGQFFEEGRYPGKVAFLFTGQGSQYIGMGLDLAERYPIVRATFEEADAVLASELPRPLTSYIRRDPSIPEDEQFEALRATEISQPATLTMDVALLRLLAAFGIYPDMVAGHSLGEYAAAVAAGMMTFPDALIAVSARGREMASVKIADPGKMAGVALREDAVEEVLSQVQGYVVAANKNCPTQTVIAGETAAVETAMALFKERGVTVTGLPVSHAFHSRIVAPASAPFKRVLQRLGIQPPRRPFLTNVDASYYSTDPADREAIIENLAQQIASPVEWIRQIEQMYADGARIFIECGPKRALCGFVTAILRRQEHRSLYTNHPKHGGVASFHEALASFAALGRPIRQHPTDPDLFADLAAPAAPAAGLPATAAPASVDLSPVVAVLREHDPALSAADLQTPAALAAALRRLLAAHKAPPTAVDGLPTALISALSEGAVRGGLPGPQADGFAQAVAPALSDLVAAIRAALPAPAPAPAPAPRPVIEVLPAAAAPGVLPVVEVVCSGIAIGLPGGKEVFSPDNFHAVLSGENRISRLSEALLDRMIGKRVMRLQKDAQTGQGTFVPVEEREQVIRLAGVKAAFDLVGDYGVEESRARALDVTTQLAFAAGIEALRDAGIPLVQTFRETTSGRRIADRWMLPEPLRRGTGIIFASAFPGYTNFAEHIKHDGDDGEGRFDRRFLFQILSMGHSQFAELIGAMGPNTQVNAACASTTQAVAIASDWIRLGRAERVIVIGADDVTNETMMEWIGAGFLASGAATTEDRVEEAALPFDRRRHGMIIGMGAVGMVLERATDAAARGVTPIARLLASRVANSAFHGTRLHPTHIADEVDALVEEAARNTGRSRAEIAAATVFMSHETYTPARGGSAAAEIASLRHAFGAAAREVLVTNTKGFTGHPMGAGIEDAVVLKALQLGQVPPIPNLKEPDPDLGDLRLSTGGRFPVRYALRLAAGFGSQLALLAWEKLADGEQRTHAARYSAWLAAVSGYDAAQTVVQSRSLRVIPAEKPTTAAPTPAPEPTPIPEPSPAPQKASSAEVLAGVMAIIAEKTGYAAGELEPDYELEADLGVDTVKQAEIFSVVRERFGIPQDDDFRLADYPTIEKLAGWVAARVGAAPASTPAPAPAAAPAPAPAAAPAAVAPAGDVLAEVMAVIAEKTGYAVSELEPGYELEADLGVDTVKQAEIFSVVRERFGIPQDDDFRLADYPTIEKLAGWVASRTQGTPAPAPAPAAEPAPAPAPAAAPTVTVAPQGGADVLAEVMAVIAEKTGYAVSELEPGYELEADLGVDTVKQAEIFSVVRERYGIPQDDDFRLADYPTIEKLAGWIAGRRASAPEAAAAVTATAAVAAAAVAKALPVETVPLASSEVLALLIRVTAEKTGYAEDEIEPGYELEADLGVDTVKQAEIFSEVLAALGLARDEELRLADYPTIEKLAGYLSQRVAAGEVGAVPEVSEEVPHLEKAADPLDVPEPRRAVVSDPLALPGTFRVRRPVLMPLPAWAGGTLEGRAVCVVGQGKLAEALRLALQARGAMLVAGEATPELVVDASPDVMDGFLLARTLEQAGTRPSDWLCVTRLGTDPTEVPSEVGAQAGARAGFTKALGREWSGCAARVVDVAPLVSDEAAAEMVCDELGGADGAVEVFRDGMARWTLALQVEPLPPRDLPLVGRPVVVLTGGTRGITARVAQELARRGDCRLALLARTPPGTEPLDEETARQRIRAELKAAGERGSPAQVEARLRPLLRAEEARASVEAMRAHGAEVRFWAADTSDPEAVASVLDEIRAAWGPIDGVIHGAGAEESRLLADKDEAAFRRVFDGKALGGLALAAVLEPTAWLVSMGSVAGRFGNAGQVDYAAANEAMARVCLGRPRSLHVDWTAWADVGMAVRGGMEHLLTERGMELLPAGPGAALLVDLVQAEQWGEVVVAGRLGDFDAPAAHPLLDSVIYDGDGVVATRVLSLARDPWIQDHSIDGTPVLPGVVGLELMAAAARLCQPGQRPCGASDVRFEAPVKLYGDQPTTLRIHATLRAPGEVEARLVSERTSRAGKLISAPHFSAVIRLGEEEQPPLPLPPAMLGDADLSRGEIYRRFFHGPVFRVLTEAPGIALDALEAGVTVSHAPLGGAGLLTQPLLLEAAFQAAGLHRMVLDSEVALPSHVEQVSLLSRPEDGASLWAAVRRRADGCYDIDIDSEEEPVLRVRGFALIRLGDLPPGDRVAPPEDGWPAAIVAQASFEAPPRVVPPGEKAALTARGTLRRQQDRVAGQAAARLALQRLLGTADFSLGRLPSGEPVVSGAAARVSISHRAGRGWAVACAPTAGWPGLDIEEIAVRPDSFARTWLTSGEQALSGGSALRETLIWAAKEAVLKALGTGLRLGAHAVEVTALGPGTLEARLAHTDAPPLRLFWRRLGAEVVVTVCLPTALRAAGAARHVA